MTREAKAYSRFYIVVRFIFALFYRIKISGRENLNKLCSNGAVVCANHSSWLDPFLVGFAFNRHDNLHMMGKVELFNIPIVGTFIRHIGMFPVTRGTSDIGAIKTAMKFLKDGEKVLIFPEGTRVSQDDAINAKSGAVRLADRTHVQVIPVNIPRRKPLFHKLVISVGEPYYINEEHIKLSPEDYALEAEKMMDKIKALGKSVGDI